MQLRYEVEGEIVSLTIDREAEGYRVRIGERGFRARRVRARPGQICFELGGSTVTAHVAAAGEHQWIAVDGRTFTLARPAPARRRRRLAGEAGEPQAESVRAEMPGQVRSVQVNEGDAVEPGQTLMVLEAMKMEMRVAARHAGRVKRLLAREGQVVERGQALVELSTAQPPGHPTI